MRFGLDMCLRRRKSPSWYSIEERWPPGLQDDRMRSRSQGLRLWRVSMRRGRNSVIRVRIIDLYHRLPPIVSMNLLEIQSLWHRLIPYGEAWLLQIPGAPPWWLRRPQGPMCPVRLTSDHQREKPSYGIDKPVIVTSPESNEVWYRWIWHDMGSKARKIRKDRGHELIIKFSMCRSTNQPIWPLTPQNSLLQGEFHFISWLTNGITTWNGATYFNFGSTFYLRHGPGTSASGWASRGH